MSPSADIESRASQLAVLVSGNGSNLQAILDACDAGRLNAKVVMVVSNNADAYALTRAETAGVATAVAIQRNQTRQEYDADLAEMLRSLDVDLVVLAGWDRLLSNEFVTRLPTINLHPARPGAFPGLGAIERAFDAWKQGTTTSGGVMVHTVADEGVDCGPVIVAEDVPFHADDTINSFTERVHQVEHRLLVTAIDQVISQTENS